MKSPRGRVRTKELTDEEDGTTTRLVCQVILGLIETSEGLAAMSDLAYTDARDVHPTLWFYPVVFNAKTSMRVKAELGL